MAFSAESILEGLKPFQRDTVDHVFDRFFGTDPVDRFLVADEVGLGKTMVARGLIAKLIEHHLAEPERRIDVIYICSNQAIAQQNFSKLAIVGRDQRPVTDRITTLPIHVSGLNEHAPGFDRGINIIPITPTTSLDLRSGVGRKDERALLWWMLRDERLLGRSRMSTDGTMRLLGPPARTRASFDHERERLRHCRIDADLWEEFTLTVSSAPPINGQSVLEEFDELRLALRVPGREYEWPWNGRRTALVARLRQLLAQSCIESLEPDLVILDEFQRFPKVLDPDDPTGDLAQRLFAFPGCKALLLSATPYRMFTRAHELDDDHHSDFLTTTGFLLNQSGRINELTTSMANYRTALHGISNDGVEPVRQARSAVQRELGRVMCRTERLGASDDRNGMLDPNPAGQVKAQVTRGDLEAYRELDGVARRVGTRDVLEFWKSTPYALNLMDDYALSHAFEEHAELGLVGSLSHTLDVEAVRAYRKLDPGNARLRGLWTDLDEQLAWKQLWLPPSLAYHAPGPPFDKATMATKRLVFSAWTVVPKAIAALTSYHVERQALAAHNRRSPIENNAAGRKTLGAPLQWRADGALTETLITLPGRRLAELTDPLEIARADPGGAGAATPRAVLAEAERRIKRALADLNLPQEGGRVDRSWYAVAMLRLDEKAYRGSVARWLTPDALGDDEEGGAWARHARRLLATLTTDPEGAVPKDLARVLALVGVGGPGVCALRALSRTFPDDDPHRIADAALRIGNALRLMFNLPEAVALVGELAGSSAHWRGALRYAVNGNLQAVLDEYMHVLRDWVGTSKDEGKLGPLRDTAVEAIGVKASPLSVREIESDGAVAARPMSLRSRFALRLDKGATEDEAAVQRVDTVRKAFNSPFWPFVLATTSVGQEGLDFHLYCHAVVHWNLPHNPVDLEQREGRVHRFKNHAVRRNIAEALREYAFEGGAGAPWDALFDAAPETDGGLSPDWVYPGSARIERHVPCEPMSADQHRLSELIRLLGIYRLAFGQPRQDELLAALRIHPDLERQIEDLLIDMSPPSRT